MPILYNTITDHFKRTTVKVQVKANPISRLILNNNFLRFAGVQILFI